MSDTPRTDTVLFNARSEEDDEIVWVVDVDFSRRLERENAALRDQLREANEDADNLFGALILAKHTIRLWHGHECWPEYQESPEMKKINRRMEAHRARIAKEKP